MSLIKLMRSVIIAEDCYKFSHPFMVSRDVTGLTSYIEARKSDWADKIVFFGLQAYIREYLDTPITMADIDFAEKLAKSALIPFHREMWEAVVNECGGYLPIQIAALPEGTPVKPGIPVVQITTTFRYPAILSVIETSLLRAIWYPSSVATLSRHIKAHLKDMLEVTSDVDPDKLLPTMLNDFGGRGASSGESAALGGMGHLINFIGSDTVEAIPAAMMYYDHDLDTDGPVLISVPATEHSVTTINGEEKECEFVGRVIDIFTEQGFPIISIVADSYDMERFVSTYIGVIHKSKILNRDGFIVVRPDSGEPTVIVPQVMNLLWDKFGGEVNSKGYKVLNPKVRIIQGDGINRESIKDILFAVGRAGFSVENLVFGMGGQLLQGPMRDDHSWAMKTNAVKHGDGEWKDVQKKPKTDMSKASKAGRQVVVFYQDDYHSVHEYELEAVAHGTKNWLEDVWDTGLTFRTQTFADVRERAKL